MSARVDFEIPPDAAMLRCRSCGAAIAWAKTKAGKQMPLDLATVEEREGKRYAESHFARCKDAAGWRKKS